MQKSFDEMQTWITELKQLGPPNIVLAIAGNKNDLESERRVGRIRELVYSYRPHCVGVSFMNVYFIGAICNR